MAAEEDKLAGTCDLSEIVKKVRAQTPARLLAGRTGAAYRTNTQLELREAHAAARDAVREELNLFTDPPTTSRGNGICLRSAPRRRAKMNIFCAPTWAVTSMKRLARR